MLSSRDLRGLPLYRQVRDFYDEITGGGREVITDAADVTVSPDGLLAAFTGTLHRDVTQAPVTRLCLINLASRQTTQIPTAKATGSDRLPRWSPDGRWLSFVSDRAEAGNYQLYLYPASGIGDVRPAPTVDGIIESAQWSPDGRSVLLLVAGFGADLAGCQGGATTLRRTDGGELPPPWAPTIDTGDAGNLWRRVFVLDVVTSGMTLLPTPALNCWEATWLGNERIAVVTSESHAEGSWYRSQLICISLADGARRVVYRPADQIGVPAASPSGRTLALIEAVCSDRMIVSGKLLLIDPETGTVRQQDTHGVDVTHAVWRDERHLAFAGHRSLETVAGEVDTQSGRIIEHWAGTGRTFGSWYPTMWPIPGGGCVAIGEGYDVAPEVALLRDGDYEVIASFDARGARPASRATIETLSWQGRDGLELQGWLVKPDRAAPMPLVMDIHGGPVWACRNRWQGRLRGARVLTDHGIAVFYPNPRGSGGRGLEFARLVVGDMAGEDTYDYLTGVDELVRRGTADPRRLGVTGISYGGFMSAWLITQDSRFAAAAPISCVSDWYSQHRTSQIPDFDELFLNASARAAGGRFFDRSPVMHADKVRTPTLQLTGALDQNTPPTQALEFHRSLLESGVRSVLVTYPNAGHGVRSFPEVIDATTRYVGWFLEHLGPRRD